MNKNRTAYSARNTMVAIAANILSILAGFVTRIVFTHTLRQDYVGINGLFSDILNMLALTELGASTAVSYALYRPVAERDVEKQKSLLRMFKHFYQGVAAAVFFLGLLVIPFMDVLIKSRPEVDHLYLIYILYLINSVLSYLMAYKRLLVDAHQLSYISTLYRTGSWFIQNILQVIVLLVSGNFILFVSMMILCTILNNIAISHKADQLYPYLRDSKVEKLPVSDRREIFRNIRAMLMHKTGTVIVNNTDNLLLSALVGIVSNSLYSNYSLIMGSVKQILAQLFQGIAASVGNLGVEEDKEQVRKIFEAVFFMGQWLFGFATICIFEIIDIFAGLCFGASYVFPRHVTLVLCLNFYFTGMRQACLVFRDSMGIFWYDRYKSLAEAVINLGVSIVLGRQFGVTGIFLGTLVSTAATSLWIEPYMLYRHGLGYSPGRYFLRYGIYTVVTFALWYGVDLWCSAMTGTAWWICIKRLALCLSVVNLVYLLLYYRTKEFRLLAEKSRYLLRNRFTGA